MKKKIGAAKFLAAWLVIALHMPLHVAADDNTSVTGEGAMVLENGVKVCAPENAGLLQSDPTVATPVVLTNAGADEVAYVLIDGTEAVYAKKSADTIWVFGTLTENTIIEIGYYAPVWSVQDLANEYIGKTLIQGTDFKDFNSHVTFDFLSFNAQNVSGYRSSSACGTTANWILPNMNFTARYTVPTATYDMIKANVQGNCTMLYDSENDLYYDSAKAINTVGTIQVACEIYNAVEKIIAEGNEPVLNNGMYEIEVLYSAPKNGWMHFKGTPKEITIHAPVAGEYTLLTRANCFSLRRAPKVSVNGDSWISATAVFEKQTGTTFYEHIVYLEKGDNSIQVKSGDGGLAYYDFMAVLANDSYKYTVLEDISVNEENGNSIGPKSFYKAAGLDLPKAITDDATIMLGKVVVSNNAATAFAKAGGDVREYGIKIAGTNYKALAASKDEGYEGVYAVEVENPNGWAADTQIQAYVLNLDNQEIVSEDNVNVVNGVYNIQ